MATRMRRSNGRTTKPVTSNSVPSGSSELPTFLDHIHELRRRLFWVVAVILVTSTAAYPFLDSIISVLTAPLGPQRLYYLTPIGGLSFSIKICLYIGVIAAVPFLMYHIYRYLEPIMGQWRKSALFYVGLSTVFATAGILFAYFVSLPGALRFLTGLNLSNVQAMLTVDSYLSFVMTYLLGAALLFQIPLLLLIINTMTPLKPAKLMKSQRFIIVGAFIVAAIISPTPDIMNQILFALPIIAMYQIGIGLVWVQNRSRQRKQKQQPAYEQTQVVAQSDAMVSDNALLRPAPNTLLAPKPAAVQTPALTVRHMDVFAKPHTALGSAPKPTQPLPTAKAIPRPQQFSDVMPRQQTRITMQPAKRHIPVVAQRKIRVPQRSVDGFLAYRSSSLVSSS